MTPVNFMGGGGMASSTGKIKPLGVHVNVKFFVRGDQGGIDVSPLYPVATTAIEVAFTAGFPGGRSYVLGYKGKIYRLKELFAGKDLVL